MITINYYIQNDEYQYQEPEKKHRHHKHKRHHQNKEEENDISLSSDYESSEKSNSNTPLIFSIFLILFSTIIILKKLKISPVSFCCAVTLILLAYISIKRKSNNNKLIDEYCKMIINTLKEQRGRKIFIDEFVPPENDPLYNYWDEIIVKVESNENVMVFAVNSGTQWKYAGKH